MRAEKFIGDTVEQLELVLSHLVAHDGHCLLYSLVDLSTAAVRCSSCKCDVVSGSRELVESVWLNWSMARSE